MIDDIRNEDGLTEKEFLERYRPGDYKHPALTADAAVFWRGNDSLKVLLIRRKNHPCIGRFALPGGFVNPDENTLAAVKRELAEETSMEDAVFVTLGTFSNPGRDPRDWVVTEAFATLLDKEPRVLAGDDAADAVWFDFVYEYVCGKIKITLTSADTVLHSTVDMRERESGLGKELNPVVVSNDGLAFDHAAVLATAAVRFLSAKI